MTSPQIKHLARRLDSLEKQARQHKLPTLGHSSIDGGALQANDDDGALTMIIGEQFDGTNAAAPVTGPIPPTPSAPVVEPIIGGLKVKVDGTFADNSIIPMDFARWEIHVSQDPEFIPDLSSTLYATIESPRGGEHSVALPYTPHYVRVVARTVPGKGSAPSAMAGPHQPRFVAQVDLDPEIDLGGGPAGPDGLVPDSSPEAIVSPLGIGALLAAWAPVANADPVTYDIYVSLAPITSPDPAMLLTSTQATQVAISALPGGQPLPLGTRAYVRVMARDEDGESATFGIEGSAVTRKATNADISSEFVYAGLVDATQIQTGSLEAVLAVLGGLTIGDLATRHIKIDPDVGFELIDASGEPIVHFPISTEGINKFVGDLVAQGFTALGRTQFRGDDNEISMNSTFEMASGVTAPANVPTIDVSYREPLPIAAKDQTNYLITWQGPGLRYAWNDVDDRLACFTGTDTATIGSAKRGRIQQVDPLTGTLTDTPLTFMEQVSYSGATTQLYNDVEQVITYGTDVERLDMGLPGNAYDTTMDPWAMAGDGVTRSVRNDWPYEGKLAYVTRSSGNGKTFTVQFGDLPETELYGRDTRPTMSSVKIWHYNGDTRSYNSKIEISADGVSWTTIWDYTVNGTYPESLSGRTHTFPEQKVLFVRSTLSGSTANTGNHWTEIQGFGHRWDKRFIAGANHGRPVRIGNFWYMVYDVTVYGEGAFFGHFERRIGKFDLTGQQVAVYDYMPHSYEDPAYAGMFTSGGNQYPDITTDGTSLIVGQIRPTDGHMRFQHFDVSGSTLPAPHTTVITNVPHTEAGNYSVRGLLYGSFDLGAPHYLALSQDATTMWAYNAAGQRVNEQDFEVGSYALYGADVAWDGAQFIIGDQYNGIKKTSTSRSTEVVRAAFSWYDSDPAGTGTHETQVGPVAQATRRSRYGVTISTNVTIPDAGDADSPDSHRLYAYEGSAYTGTSDLQLLPALTATQETPYGNFTSTTQRFANGAVVGTTAPPLTNSFPDGFAAEFRSAIGGFVVRGDGTGAWPSLENKITTGYNAAIAAAVQDAMAGMWSPGDLKASARPGDTIPGSWLECDGRRLVQNDYLDLYNAIGFTYGANLGDGTFPLPDFRRRTFKGVSTDLAAGATGGAETSVITTLNLPPHTHDKGTLATDDPGNHRHDVDRGEALGGSGNRVVQSNTVDRGTATSSYAGAHTHNITGSTGNGPGTSTPLDTQDPYVAVRVWIKT